MVANTNPTLAPIGESPMAQLICPGNRTGICIGLKIQVLRVRIPFGAFIWRSGRVWFNAMVLKTIEPKGSKGSNPFCAVYEHVAKLVRHLTFNQKISKVQILSCSFMQY